jgi:hypothetical protein
MFSNGKSLLLGFTAKMWRSFGVGMERSGMTYPLWRPSRLLAAKRNQTCYAQWGRFTLFYYFQ